MSVNKIIVEITCAQTHKPSLHVCEKSKITIGRSYDCDVVLDDDFISAHHIEISKHDDPMRFEVRDLASENGTIFDRKCFKDSHVDVLSGEGIRIGKTRVRILSAAHPVAPARRVNFGSKLQGLCDRFFIAFLLLAFGTALGVIFDWHISDPNNYFDEDVYKLIAGYVVIPLVMALITSVMRMLSHKKVYFNREISIWSILVAISTFTAFVLPYIYFFVHTIFVQNIMSAGCVVLYCVFVGIFRSYIYDGRVSFKIFVLSFVVGILLSSSVFLPTIGYNVEPQYPSQILVRDGTGFDLKSPEAFLDRASDLFSAQNAPDSSVTEEMIEE